MTRTSSDAADRAAFPARSAALATAASLAATLVLAGATAAGAQTGTVPSTTVAPPENPSSTAAGVVFFAVCGVIIVGALVLYLRNRRPRSTSSTSSGVPR